MSRLQYENGHGGVGSTRSTEIDSCPFGHGLWFDRGELQTVIESLDEPLKSVVVRELQAIFS